MVVNIAAHPLLVNELAVMCTIIERSSTRREGTKPRMFG
jgi:hypothetical protein